MLPKRRFIRPVDAMMLVYEEAPSRSEPGIDYSTTAGLSLVARVPVSQSACRESDIALADAGGWELTRKVSSRDLVLMNPGMLAVIDGTVYEVPHVDRDHALRLMWCQLSELACDGKVELYDRGPGRDALGNPNGQWKPAGEAYCRRRSWKSTRSDKGGQDYMRPALELTLRRCDWGDGHMRIVRDGIPYAVTEASSRGEWIDVRASRRDGDAHAASL